MSASREPTPIENWSVTDRCPFAPYRAPELDPHLHLEGDVAGRGGPICTTRIIKTEGRVVSTRSGSLYLLGTPARAYVSWLAAQHKTIDEKNPIKLPRRGAKGSRK